MKLIEDRRIAGLLRYHVCSEVETLMQIPPAVRQCVAFIYAEPRARRVPEGTVFFVSISDRDPDPEGNRYWTYAVTAKHVLTSLKKERHKRVLIRLNRQSGTIWQQSKIDDWTFHPETDLAAIHFPLPPEAECTPFPARRHLIDDVIRSRGIGPGEDIFLTGLFVQRPGEDRNLPIIRVGNIAALPDEPIRTNHGTFKAYLIEARSLGGLSGSPVFVNLGGFRRVDVDTVSPHGFAEYALTTGFLLLGVAYGHYEKRVPRRDRGDEYVNVGISLVIPADRILELLNTEQEIEMRKKQSEKDQDAEEQNIVADSRLRRKS